MSGSLGAVNKAIILTPFYLGRRGGGPHGHCEEQGLLYVCSLPIVISHLPPEGGVTPGPSVPNLLCPYLSQSRSRVLLHRPPPADLTSAALILSRSAPPPAQRSTAFFLLLHIPALGTCRSSSLPGKSLFHPIFTRLSFCLCFIRNFVTVQPH